MIIMTVLQYPIATEKALNMVETRNTIIYIVNLSADKKTITEEFEKTFNVKVDYVNTAISPENQKKAYIRLKPEYPASDIAKKLKLV